MLVLVDRNEGLSQMALARALGIDRSTLVPILDRRQARDLLVRRPSPTDGRTHALALTSAGAKALARFGRLVRAHETVSYTHLLEGWAPDVVRVPTLRDALLAERSSG